MGEVVQLSNARGQLVPWPGKRIRETHAALLRAERIHDLTQHKTDWDYVQERLADYMQACQDEGIAP